MFTREDAERWGWGNRAEAFASWRNEMDTHVVKLLGMSTDDLPDWDFARAFDAGMSAEEAAQDFASDMVEEFDLDRADFEGLWD